ncbi:hypothetical protein ACOSQ3_022819 [Xanthoceras sorbifolium]
MIPAESIASTHRMVTFNAEQNTDLLTTTLDLIEEKREAARLKIAVYQQRVARYYNIKVKIRHFRIGDLVLRLLQQLLLPGARNQQEGALGPNWEGPYVIYEDLNNGMYHFVTIDGARVLRSWNAEHLRKYYQ